MELRWYGRILMRQRGVIWRATVLVAVLSLLLTAWSAYNERYKASETIEFNEQPILQKTQNITIDPVSAAEGNASAATNEAKLYTEGDRFFKAISQHMKSTYGKTVDYKSIHIGATATGSRELKIDYSSTNSTNATQLVQSGVYTLQHDFLPGYNLKFLQDTAPGFTENVFSPPITIDPNFDPLNVRTQSLSQALTAWLLKVLLGVVVGVALAFLWEYLDETIHDEHDVRSWMDLPTLGVIPGGRARTDRKIA